MNENILSSLGYATSPPIKERTAMRCLHSLNISFREVKEHKYIDGHERKKVIAYRQMLLEQKRKYENVCLYWRSWMEMMRMFVLRCQ